MHADLTSAKGLTQEQLDQACGENVNGLPLKSLDLSLTFHDKRCPEKPKPQ